ncbi:alternative ribosome rescue aminoacyl-tRNA hydrolase ArfB [Nitrosomonadaceae bacterium]|nr:alternative ribosome rescue aminoacyl-tRNA hydrolase ArfB [Nitrosomonadaceae bacterium]
MNKCTLYRITSKVTIADNEIKINAIRAQGAGGQNVNKVSNAIHLRFSIKSSSLPGSFKERLLQLNDQRINSEGIIVIKAQRYRSKEKNREEALKRLFKLIESVSSVPRKRRATRPTMSSNRKRLDSKTRHGQIKIMRQKVSD